MPAKLDVIDAADKAAVEAVMAECEQQLLALGLAVEKADA